ncbi:hypothetical protein DFH08DRAFT_1019750 [Mycena albidolilacea]|uniref:DUF6532 domain-containing protein n=1 Tax=Mycena albidolilacea TaxID=1033008 RepID=A0AAD6ZPN3_9AGAR|nr:hypothetical protein DFH08DRAFT_1019750 [Mycena albidolilacea]
MAKGSSRPRPRPLDDHEDTIPTNNIAAVREQAPTRLWNGAAPKGPRPRDTQQKDDPTIAGTRKRLASTTKQSAKQKTVKTTHQADAPEQIDDSMEDIEESEPPPPARSRRSRKSIPDSDEELAEDSSLRLRVTKQKKHQKPAATEALDKAFDDEEDVQSDGGVNGPHENDSDGVEDPGDNDLEGLDPEELQRRLTEEAPRWSHDDKNDENDEEGSPSHHSRPSSRASFSSGYQSVPASEFVVEISSDSDSDSDPSMQAAFSSMSAAHARAPALKATIRKTSTPKHTAPIVPKLTSSAPPPRRLDLSQLVSSDGRRSGSARPASKREAVRAKEVGQSDIINKFLTIFYQRPVWNNERAISRAPSHRPSARVKLEPQDAAFVPGIKRESEDRAQIEDDNNIDIRYNSRDTVNLKDQHRDVGKTCQLGLDYYFGFHLTRNSYPDVPLKTQFAFDSLSRSAHDQNFTSIHWRLLNDEAYREGLATVLFGRISTFRGNVKAVAESIIYGKYGVQQDCAGLVGRLIAGQSYIYPHKPDKLNPRTNLIEFGQADCKRPYEHEAIPAVVGGFFKGNNSIVERIQAMLERNEAGNYEATQPMVAIACAGIHSVLDDHSTGEYKRSNFDGSRVQDIYDVHILLLETIKEEKPDKYRVMMENIFTLASRGTSFTKGTKAAPTLLQKEALAKLDLSD